MQDFDVIVAGGGMAGLSCALFLARAQVRVAVFDQAQSSLRRVSRVNNYVGFPEGISGSDLLQLARRHAERFGAHVLDADIQSVERRDGSFVVFTHVVEPAAQARAEGGTKRHEQRCSFFVLAANKRTDLALQLGLRLAGFGDRFVGVDSEGKTALDNCYATGRITGLPSQAVISAGDGAKVAIHLVQKIRGEYYIDHDT